MARKTASSVLALGEPLCAFPLGWWADQRTNYTGHPGFKRELNLSHETCRAGNRMCLPSPTECKTGDKT